MTKDTITAKDETERKTSLDRSSKSKRPKYLFAGVSGFAALALMFGGFAVGQAFQTSNATQSDTVRLAMHRSAKPDLHRDDAAMGMGHETKQRKHVHTDTVSTTRVAGVVTAVSGSTLTVAGNGTTTKVELSDNTTYYGDDEPAQVNDTIRVHGATDSDGALVASHVHLIRE